MNICVCGKETKNPKFCSRSCSVRTNNKKPRNRLKPSKEYYCRVCNILIGIGAKSAGMYCDTHKPNVGKFNWSTVTLEELYSFLPTHQAHGRIRSKARSACPFSPCVNCGYSKHTEVCHKKPISSFSKETLVSIVNDVNNLIRLCPNCHWELDNGHLDLFLLKSYSVIE